ncbi:DNA-deoxyinosine glycosylase [Marilutibacter chinensis]|uniref:DNA-deoxyinosine glycosylase n=1 Tax=Marilutibacter chinensis TaxID=2912247 RepID=A0ABS9HWL9_9GAMM|nr:DNA-deoxyinosine glycosylase [Lysobacter chinensis]MCF7223168.1 DNA-deoxyinosine glycosylase [Lysobacter chinensis]
MNASARPSPVASPRLAGLAPVVGDAPRALVLGSMPGAASLDAGQYYAHPRNSFWPFMGTLVGASPGLTYPERTARLAAAGIAVWDVIASCRRRGSLDSAIRDIQPNDFPAFLAEHATIGSVLFNGAMAEATFMRLVEPALSEHGLSDRLRYRRLPSTSPANAAQPRTVKLEAWRAALAESGVACVG